MLKHVRVRQNRRQVSAQTVLEHDLAADEAVQHLALVLEDSIQIQDFLRDSLLSCGRQELADERRGAIPRGRDLLKLGGVGRLLRLAQQQISLAGNDSEQIVEMMGHAAGYLA